MEMASYEDTLQQAAERQAKCRRVKEMLVDRLELPIEPDWITDDQALIGRGLELDSVDTLELMIGIEAEFGVTILDDEVAAFGSVSRLRVISSPVATLIRPDEARWQVPIEADGIRAILPHRWPFLYLDRVTRLDPGRSGTGLKNVTVSEGHFAGHFPHESVMPGVLVVEAMAQLAGIVSAAGQHSTNGSGRCYLAAVNRFRFRSPVRPGDQLVLDAKASAGGNGLAEFEVEAHVDRQRVAHGRLILAT
jgi:3-hydroxyacyl-[acyl-carrier-protein] dehydratase